jgi:hypothetical protein
VTLLRALVITVGLLVTVYVATQVLMIGLVFVTLTGGPGCWFAPTRTTSSRRCGSRQIQTGSAGLAVR